MFPDTQNIFLGGKELAFRAHDLVHDVRNRNCQGQILVLEAGILVSENKNMDMSSSLFEGIELNSIASLTVVKDEK